MTKPEVLLSTASGSKPVGSAAMPMTRVVSARRRARGGSKPTRRNSPREARFPSQFLREQAATRSLASSREVQSEFQTAATKPSRRGSQCRRTPVRGSRVMPCMPPTAMVQASRRLDLVAACAQGVERRGGKPRLDLHAPPVPKPGARRIDRVLERQTEIEMLHHHLRLRLADAVASGRPEHEGELAVTRRDRGRKRQGELGLRHEDDCVHRGDLCPN